MFAAVLLLLVFGGLVTYLALPGNSGRQNAAPFYRAVENLFSQPMTHYTGSSMGGIATWDISALRGGDVVGTITTEGERIGYLSVGGRNYLKLPPDLLSGALPAGANADAMQGRWITGSDELGMLLPPAVQSPQAMASQLSRALDATANFPAAGSTVRVGSDEAYQVQTPLGTLAVTPTAPYRVLQFSPSPRSGGALGGLPSELSIPSELSPPPGQSPDLSGPPVAPTHAAIPSDLMSSLRAAAPGGGGSGAISGPQITFQPPTDSGPDVAFGDLENQTAGLTDAVNVGISMDFDHTGGLSCSNSSCTVNETVRASAKSDKQAQLQGTVRASMVANITVNDEAAGSCSATGELPVDGSGVITCVDDVTGAVGQLRAQLQEQANEQAQATGQNVEEPLNLSFSASVDIEALATVQADVDQAVNAERDEQNADDQRAGCPTAACELAGTPRSGPAGSKTIDSGGSGSNAFQVNVDNPNPGRAGAAIDVSAGGDTYYYDPANASWSNQSGVALSPAIADQIPQSVVDEGFKDLGLGGP